MFGYEDFIMEEILNEETEMRIQVERRQHY